MRVYSSTTKHYRLLLPSVPLYWRLCRPVEFRACHGAARECRACHGAARECRAVPRPARLVVPRPAVWCRPVVTECRSPAARSEGGRRTSLTEQRLAPPSLPGGGDGTRPDGPPASRHVMSAQQPPILSRRRLMPTAERRAAPCESSRGG